MHDGFHIGFVRHVDEVREQDTERGVQPLHLRCDGRQRSSHGFVFSVTFGCLGCALLVGSDRIRIGVDGVRYVVRDETTYLALVVRSQAKAPAHRPQRRRAQRTPDQRRRLHRRVRLASTRSSGLHDSWRAQRRRTMLRVEACRDTVEDDDLRIGTADFASEAVREILNARKREPSVAKGLVAAEVDSGARLHVGSADDGAESIECRFVGRHGGRELVQQLVREDSTIVEIEEAELGKVGTGVLTRFATTC